MHNIIYFPSQVAIPRAHRIRCLGWNPKSGVLAVGGDNAELNEDLEDDNEDVCPEGFLRVVQLKGGVDGPESVWHTNWSVEQNVSLLSHNTTVHIVDWNAGNELLASCDRSGLINVWSQDEVGWWENVQLWQS